MAVIITKATNEDMSKANEFLTRLIQDEKKYDANVNEQCVISDYYEHVYSALDKCLLIAKADNQIIGYLYGYLIDNGNTVLELVARLDALFVEETNRGLGVGTKLITEFKKWAQESNCKYIEVGVYNSNIEAKSLYQNNGFLPVKTTMAWIAEDIKEEESENNG
ncbi:MAG TPA: GNAT family N-acetyltransferase, partial [Bacilli bacterium]|nr:GNAT family N-acetyltransferase [Bacilli bacterium]